MIAKHRGTSIRLTARLSTHWSERVFNLKPRTGAYLGGDPLKVVLRFPAKVLNSFLGGDNSPVYGNFSGFWCDVEKFGVIVNVIVLWVSCLLLWFDAVSPLLQNYLNYSE